jgi:hypothetical protein
MFLLVVLAHPHPLLSFRLLVLFFVFNRTDFPHMRIEYYIESPLDDVIIIVSAVAARSKSPSLSPLN